MKEKQCPTHFLSDAPVEKDDFGTHEKVAKALLELICNGNSDTVHSIALEGAWGSGKSTVIKILKRLIQQEQCNEEIAIFVYDTWAHQGDSLRRSFLERLIDFLIQRGWVDEEKWREEKKILSRRQEETTITSTPSLTKKGAFLAISLGLVPVGISLSTIGGVARFLGILFTASPLFILLPSFFERKSKNENEDNNDELIYIFLQKTREIQKTRTTRTPDPTSVEFSTSFKELTDEAFGKQGKSRKLLIVMDNLDRLPSQEALQVWATMRTFFEEGSRTWQNRLYLLVPLAPEALSRLWNDVEGDSIARAFVEKTFQVRFHVPPPVLSDWNIFMKEQLEKALPRHRGEPEIEEIIRLFRLKGLPDNRPLTPRDIKLFINRLGVIHTQWEDEIPLPIQAAYVFYQNEIKTPSEDLTKGNFLDKQVESILQEKEWQKHFAAMYFNVPPEKALQVLIGQQVESALSNGKAETLKRYENIPGFEHVIEETLDRHLVFWAETQPETVVKLPRVFQEITKETPFWSRLWNRIRTAIEHLERPISYFGPEEGEGFKALLERYDEEGLLEYIIKIIMKSFPEASEEDDEEKISENIQNWTHGVYIVVEWAVKHGYESVVQEHFRVPGTSEDYIKVMLTLSTKGVKENIGQYFVPSEKEKIVERLVNVVQQRSIPMGWGKAVRLMTAIGTNWPWRNLVDIINQTTFSTSQWKEVIEALWYIHKLERKVEEDFQARQVLEQITKDGRVFHYLYASYQEQDWETAAWNLLVLLSLNSTGQLQRHWNNSNAGLNLFRQLLQNPESYSNLLTSFADLVRMHENLATLLNLHNTHPNTWKWIEKVFEQILQDEAAFFLPKVIVGHYSAFMNLPEDLQEKIISKTGESIAQELMNRRFSSELSDLYLKVLVSLDSTSTEFEEFLKNGLRRIEKEKWNEALQETNSLFRLLQHFLEKYGSLNLGHHFSDALIDWTQSLFEEEIEIPNELKPKYARLPHALEVNARKTFFRNLRDLLIDNANQDLSMVLEIFGDELIASNVLVEKADEITRRLFREIVKGGVDVEIDWMLKVFEKDKNFLSEVPESSLADFRDRLKALIEKSDFPGDLQKRLENLLKSLSQTVERKKANDSL